jgi:hypothetical protein
MAWCAASIMSQQSRVVDYLVVIPIGVVDPVPGEFSTD